MGVWVQVKLGALKDMHNQDRRTGRVEWMCDRGAASCVIVELTCH